MIPAQSNPLRPKPGARAQRSDGRPAFEAEARRARQPVTNAEWFAMRRQHTRAVFLEAIFTRLLAKVKR